MKKKHGYKKGAENRGGVSKYPWDKWFARKNALTLTQGVDFHCQLHGMANQIRNAASKRSVSISLEIEGSSITMRVNR